MILVSLFKKANVSEVILWLLIIHQYKLNIILINMIEIYRIRWKYGKWTLDNLSDNILKNQNKGYPAFHLQINNSEY